MLYIDISSSINSRLTAKLMMYLYIELGELFFAGGGSLIKNMYFLRINRCRMLIVY